MTIRVGDIIVAREGTVTALFAEGREGVVVGLPPWSSNRLVRWEGDPILMGFHYENVEVVRAVDEAPAEA